MGRYNQLMVTPKELSEALNSLKNDGKDIVYVVPCHEYDGTLIVIVYTEDKERKECLSCKGSYFRDIGFDIDCEARGIELNYCPECGRKLHG